MTTNTPAEGSRFSRFMASCEGRMARVALGATLVTLGLTAVGGATGVGVAVAGLVPLAAGVFNLCPVAPAWGSHFFGTRYCEPRPAPIPVGDGEPSESRR